MLHLLPDLPGLWPLVALFPGLCLTMQAGQYWHTSPSFLIGSSNEDEVWGLISSTTQRILRKIQSKSSLSSSSHQILTWLLVQGTKGHGWYLITSLQNCLIIVSNVRKLCNLNERYKFSFSEFLLLYFYSKENNFQIELNWNTTILPTRIIYP